MKARVQNSSREKMNKMKIQRVWDLKFKYLFWYSWRGDNDEKILNYEINYEFYSDRENGKRGKEVDMIIKLRI
jgi:hypothetical protein